MHQGRNGFAAEEHSLLNLQARLWQYAETPQLSCRSSVKLGLLALWLAKSSEKQQWWHAQQATSNVLLNQVSAR